MADQVLLTGESSEKFISFRERFHMHNLINTKRKWMFSIRTLLTLIALATAIVNSTTAIGTPNNDIECMWDGLFALTSPLNVFFTNNTSLRHLLLIFSSSLIDFQYLFFCFRYIVWGDSARPLLFLAMFYLFRMLVQNVFMMSIPNGMIWDYPGIPSITISYAYTTDFFFSGHVGILVFTSLENYSNKNYQMMKISIFSVVVEFMVMVVLRGHYSIDLISGVIFGHYFWMLSNKIAKRTEKFFYVEKSEKKQEE